MVSFPGLTKQNIKQYLFSSLATAREYLIQTRKNIQSAKPSVLDIYLDLFPLPDSTLSNIIYTVFTDITTDKTYSDLTGRFPHTSSSGNKYIIILYYIIFNVILVCVIKNRADKNIYLVLETLFRLLLFTGFKPDIHIMDNKAFFAIKFFL